jgi:TM2 domain-containing membrane protein YozV
METPVEVKQAVTAILANLAISTLLELYRKLTGNASAELFIFTLIIYSFLCIIPYKISHKSNAARYVYLVLTIFTSLSLFAIDYEKYKLDIIVSLALIPLEIFILYRLFQKEASNWFLSK